MCLLFLFRSLLVVLLVSLDNMFCGVPSLSSLISDDANVHRYDVCLVFLLFSTCKEM
jgi:hypothetical protein